MALINTQYQPSFNAMDNDDSTNLVSVRSIIKIDQIDHHSCDIDWTDIDQQENGTNYDPNQCFILERKEQTLDGSESINDLYTGYAKKRKIGEMDSGKCYQFRLKQKDGKELSDWVTVVTNSTPTSISDIVKGVVGWGFFKQTYSFLIGKFHF